MEKSVEFLKNTMKRDRFIFEWKNLMKLLHVQASELIQDVVENILINAVQHNKNSTIEITIKISKVKQDGPRYCKIEFHDNGMGIEDERKTVIFQRVSKDSACMKGIGLGLSLVQKIIDNNEGKVWVEDRLTSSTS